MDFEILGLLVSLHIFLTVSVIESVETYEIVSVLIAAFLFELHLSSILACTCLESQTFSSKAHFLLSYLYRYLTLVSFSHVLTKHTI